MSNKKNVYKRWHGVPGLEFVWHGEWSDAEVKVHACKEQRECGIKVGTLLNAEDVEEILWDFF